jgi:hypothetical protein
MVKYFVGEVLKGLGNHLCCIGTYLEYSVKVNNIIRNMSMCLYLTPYKIGHVSFSQDFVLTGCGWNSVAVAGSESSAS